ncbi:hypothetical protein [Serratia sp. 2723]
MMFFTLQKTGWKLLHSAGDPGIKAKGLPLMARCILQRPSGKAVKQFIS